MSASRHRSRARLSRESLAFDPGSLASQAARGATGFLEGTGDHGLPAVGYAATIPGTNWTLIAKVNKQEVEAPIRRTAVNIAVTALLLGIAGSFSLYVWWRQKRAKYEAQQARTELKQQMLCKQVGFLSKYASDAMFLLTFDGEIVDANDRAESMYGFGRDQLLGMNIRALSETKQGMDLESMRQTLLQKKMLLTEAMHVRRDGSVFPVEISMGLIQTGDGLYMQEIVRDISERREADAALRASEHRLSLLFKNMTSGFAIHEGIRDAGGQVFDYRFIDVNPAFENMTGLKLEQVVGRTVRAVVPGVEPVWIARYAEVLNTGVSQYFEGYSAVLKKWFAVHAYSLEANQFATLIEDISARRETALRIQRLMNLYHALSEINNAIIHLQDARVLYQLACRIAVERGGLMLAWIGALDDEDECIVPLYSYGDANDYLKALRIPVYSAEVKGKGPTATTFREGHVVVVNDFDADAITAPWHVRAKEFGIRASATFPITHRKKRARCSPFTASKTMCSTMKSWRS